MRRGKRIWPDVLHEDGGSCPRRGSCFCVARGLATGQEKQRCAVVRVFEDLDQEIIALVWVFQVEHGVGVILVFTDRRVLPNRLTLVARHETSFYVSSQQWLGECRFGATHYFDSVRRVLTTVGPFDRRTDAVVHAILVFMKTRTT